MLLNQYNSKSVIVVFCCCFLLVFFPSHLYCVVCFLVLTLGWMLHCPRTFTRAKFNINQTCACSDCVLPCRIVREDLLHSPLNNHFNISFITYWPFTRIHFRNSFRQKNRILTIFTILFDFCIKTIVCFGLTTSL